MKVNINKNWLFTKDISLVENNAVVKEAETWEQVDLPHTWNGKDGQDGGNDYYRGTCWYAKTLTVEECRGECVYLEFEGANSSADVYVNGKLAVHHDGGYSTFRANITDLIREEGDNLILAAVDNAPNEEVYPQRADFTFYGGLYRNVNLITVPETHFDLEKLYGPAMMVKPVMQGKDAKVYIKTAVGFLCKRCGTCPYCD